MTYLTGSIGEHGPLCAYAIAETDPIPRCTNVAAWHIALLAKDLVTLLTIAACDTHVDIARKAAGEHYVQAHEYGGWCDAPGSLWHFQRNECVLDDSGEAPARAVDREAVPA